MSAVLVSPTKTVGADAVTHSAVRAGEASVYRTADVIPAEHEATGNDVTEEQIRRAAEAKRNQMLLRRARIFTAFALGGTVFSGLLLGWTRHFTGVDIRAIAAVVMGAAGLVVFRR